MTALTTELLKQRRIAGDLFCRLSCPPVKVNPDKIESKDKIGGGGKLSVVRVKLGIKQESKGKAYGRSGGSSWCREEERSGTRLAVSVKEADQWQGAFEHRRCC